MIKIHRDNTSKKERYYAITDKGIIYGSSIEIVQRKINRKGAKEKIYIKEINSQENNNFDLPF